MDCGDYQTVCPGTDWSPVPIQAMGQQEQDENRLGLCLYIFCNLPSLQLGTKPDLAQGVNLSTISLKE